MMKLALSMLFLVLETTSFCQADEIYSLTFGDTSNFVVTTYLGHQRPTKLFIIDTTGTWRSDRFWLKELNERSKSIKELEAKEHHPFNHTYLFKDTLLNMLFSDAEKQSLVKKTESLKSKKITLKGKNYVTIPPSKKAKGFYFVATEPLLTSDLKYAFIDLLVFYKDKRRQDPSEMLFATICVVFEKQPDNKWKKMKVRNHLIL
jgi:hypothetical protein